VSLNDTPSGQEKINPLLASSGKRNTMFVGTSGWAYTSWKPDFYPAKLPARRFLEYYATQLNSVEVNYTFRSLPSVQMLQTWIAMTGTHFRFSFKAPQKITHILRLRNCETAVAEFFTGLQPVVDAHRMGVLLFQLPPNFKADRQRLEDFLKVAGQGKFRLAFEFRHESWLNEPIYTLLRDHDVALCVAESEDLTVSDVATASFRCYRLRKSGYTASELKCIAQMLQESSLAGDVYAYFKHEEQPDGAQNAVKVLRSVQDS
jgi:uncharacterized protein YecE (DUF72 family)